MTDREKAIVMAYTGVVMLKGDKLGIFYDYVREILDEPLLTHELASVKTQQRIKEKSTADFMALCEKSQFGIDDDECLMLSIHIDRESLRKVLSKEENIVDISGCMYIRMEE